MLTESRGEFSDFHSIFRLRALRCIGNPSKPGRLQQRKRRQTKHLMSKTMAMHERFKSLYFSLLSSAKKTNNKWQALYMLNNTCNDGRFFVIFFSTNCWIYIFSLGSSQEKNWEYYSYANFRLSIFRAVLMWRSVQARFITFTKSSSQEKIISKVVK